MPVPVRLNWRVHMHFPEAVHLGQSEASQLVSVQLLERKISLWLILQSCSDVQLTELLIHAPSGQLVHHLHCRAGCKIQSRTDFRNSLSLSFHELEMVLHCVLCMIPAMGWRMSGGVGPSTHCRSSVCDTGLVDEGWGNKETGRWNSPF